MYGFTYYPRTFSVLCWQPRCLTDPIELLIVRWFWGRPSQRHGLHATLLAASVTATQITIILVGMFTEPVLRVRARASVAGRPTLRWRFACIVDSQISVSVCTSSPVATATL